MLNARESKTMSFIAEYVAKTGGVPPTVDEIREAAGYASKSTAVYMLKKLEENGYIRRLPGKERALEIVPVRAKYFRFDDTKKELVTMS